MLSEAISGPESFIAEVAGDDHTFQMICFDVVFYCIACTFLSTNFANVQGVPEKTFFQNFSAGHIKTLIWAFWAIPDNFLLILGILGLPGNFGQIWAFWAILGILGNSAEKF